MDIIIKGGTVVSPYGRKQTDVMIDHGRIIAVGDAGGMRAERVIDATGKIVIPGGIGPHVHIESPYMGRKGGDDYYTASVAAAIGGTTAFIDFVKPSGDTPKRELAKKRISIAEERGAVVDFSFHVVLNGATPENLGEIPELVRMGLPSFKMYTTTTRDGDIYESMRAIRESGGLPYIHAENAGIIEYLTAKALAEGRGEWINQAYTHPNISEEEAIQRMALFARRLGMPVFIAHISTHEGAALLREAKKAGLPVYGETCPHYLLFTEDRLREEEGFLYMQTPPLRRREDNEALWEALKTRSIYSTSTDHASFSRYEKAMDLKTDENGKYIREFNKVTNGVPGIEMRLPTLINGVSEGRLTWEDLVYVNSYATAKIFGFYPRKGLIEAGADADIVLVDPDKEVTVTGSMLHMKVDYSIFEGMKFKGWPVMTIQKGTVLAENGEFAGPRGHGTFFRREMDPAVLRTSDWQ